MQRKLLYVPVCISYVAVNSKFYKSVIIIICDFNKNITFKKIFTFYIGNYRVTWTLLCNEMK